MIDLALVKTYCSDAVIAEGDFHAMAAVINANYTKFQSKEVGDGAVSIALGFPAGPLFLMTLEQIANTPTDGVDQATLVKIAMCRQVWRSLTSKSFDVGNQDVRNSIDSMVGIVLTQEQADAVKTLAPVVTGGFTWEQVREAVEKGI